MMTKIKIALIVVLAFVAGLFVYNYYAPDEAPFNGTVLTIARPVGAFELTGIDAQPFNNASLRGSWTMMFFGFTDCGSVCPTTMATLNKMVVLLTKRGVSPLPHIVMISLDPKHDTLEKLQRYVHAFNPQFYGATGSAKILHAMTRELGIAYTFFNKNSDNIAPANRIEHTGTILLFNPQGEIAAFFTMPHKPLLLATDYQRLISK